ncbi:MAG: FIST N-terminal domain-containing protein [Lachnospiraceae bacterium]|nr:FIST N-terminal domain-containing protein [Lachnospiraceae bacterium]
MKFNTGSSTNQNPLLAGKEAAAQAKKGIEQIKMAFAYASCDYDLDAMLAGISEEMPGIPVIGNTSFTGVITPEGYISSGQGFVGMMTCGGTDVTVGVAAVAKTAGAYEDGMTVAKRAMEKAGKTTPPDYFYMAVPSGEEEFFLKGITKVIGRVPFFGGSAADNTIAGNWKLYTEKGVFADGIAVAFFYTEKPMVNKFTGAYRESGKVGIITKVENNRTLKEIDGMPALKKYAEWKNIDVESVKGGDLLVNSITSPLGVKDRLGDLVAIRHPMNGNDDYSISVGNNLAEGTAILLMAGSVDELIASTGETLKQLKASMKNPAAFHLVHCGGRRAGIGDRIEEVYAAIKDAAGDIPFIVEFTFGEYGFEADGLNTCGGLMLSFTGFES